MVFKILTKFFKKNDIIVFELNKKGVKVMNDKQNDLKRIILNDEMSLLLEKFFEEINQKQELKQKEPEKIILSTLNTYNCVETRIFKTPSKTVVSFLVPGIKPNSVKYSIRKIKTITGEYKYILIIYGKYDINTIKQILGKDYPNTFVYSKKDIAVPRSEFSAQFQLDKNIWNFNKIKKVVENGVLYLVLNKKQLKQKKGVKYGK